MPLGAVKDTQEDILQLKISYMRILKQVLELKGNIKDCGLIVINWFKNIGIERTLIEYHFLGALEDEVNVI